MTKCTRDDDQESKISKGPKQKTEDDSSSEDDIKLSNLKTKQTKRRCILESGDAVKIEKKSSDSGKKKTNYPVSLRKSSPTKHLTKKFY